MVVGEGEREQVKRWALQLVASLSVLLVFVSAFSAVI